MFDLKIINSVLAQLEEERGIPKEKVIEAIEMALATAYKKEYGKKGQIVRAALDMNTGGAEFSQVKIVVDKDKVIMPEEAEEMAAEKAAAAAGTTTGTSAGAKKAKKSAADKEANKETAAPTDEEEERVRYNPEHHILIEDAQRIKKGAAIDDEIVFPLEMKADFGRIAAQTAKQVIIQKIREAERDSVLAEFGKRTGDIVTGTVQRMERGAIFVDLGRATGILPYEEQIPGERYKQGERVRAYLLNVEDGMRGVGLRLSRSHPKFLEKLFEIEAPEIASKVVEIKAIAREAGSRSKVAVASTDAHIDPIGSMVGQRGVRVNTVTSELGGEKIDIIEWSADPKKFIEDALSPAKIIAVEVNTAENRATVKVAEDQQSLAIGKGGQNVRLAAKLSGWKIDIVPAKADGSVIDAIKPAEAGDVAADVADTVDAKAGESTEEKPKKKAKAAKDEAKDEAAE